MLINREEKNYTSFSKIRLICDFTSFTSVSHSVFYIILHQEKRV